MSVLVHAEVDGDRLDDRRHPARVPAHPHRRRRDDPSRHQRRHGAAAAAPGAAEVAAGRSRQDPRRGRGDAALGQPDQEHVPHGDARRRVHGPAAPRRPEVHAALRVGEPRRDAVRRSAPVRRRAPAERARRVRVRRALLPRSGARPPRAPRHVRAAADAPPRPRARRRLRRAPPPPRQLHQRPRVDAGSLHRGGAAGEPV